MINIGFIAISIPSAGADLARAARRAWRRHPPRSLCDPAFAFPKIPGRFLRCANFLPQNCPIQRNATPISVRRVRSRKPSRQHHEKLRKNSLGNYESPALTAELSARVPAQW